MKSSRQTELFCDWLENFLDYEKIRKKNSFSLDAMQFLVTRFKHPESAFRSIHVAGSKGKGSVSTMMAALVEQAGYPAGLYTSPHLVDFSERITRSGIPFQDEIYGKAADILVPLVDSIIPGSIPGNADPSWFELVTLFAFTVFKEAGLPWAILETGLGGRLDATNVIHSDASIITPVELEHTEYLGNTISSIAGEKAGIIKEGRPVFVARQKADAMAVIETKAESLGSPLFSVGQLMKITKAEPGIHGLDLEFTFDKHPGGPSFSRPIHTLLKMPTVIQAENAALAAYAAKTLFPALTEDAIEEALSKVWLPGRFETIARDPAVILDGAHTPMSLSYTIETFKTLYPGEACLVFACAADKDVETMSRICAQDFSSITVTVPGNKKPGDFLRAVKAFNTTFGEKPGTHLQFEEDYKTALLNAAEEAAQKQLPLLVTGSFYLVAEAKRILANPNQDRENLSR